MFRRRQLLYVIIPFIIAGLSMTSLQKNEAKPFHTAQEKAFFEKHLRTPIDSGEYFLGSIRCKGCHGFDTLHIASIDANGVDINLYDDWQTNMMANSSKDPLWRAKVSHEILVNPSHSLELQTKCTSCHAPMGHYTALYKGASSYTLTDLANDTLGLDGVSCSGCHEIGTQNLGALFSGDIPYDTSKKEFGPFLNPLIGPMQLYVGLIPTYSNHVSQGRFCSSCHTLIINSADLSGNYTGNTFVEQATYHEWLNSALSADDITCQHCHMPQVTDSVVIANEILSLPPRSPFNQHQFAGGNAFMVNLIKQNKTSLNISAPDVNFDSTLAATYRMLQQKSLSVQLLLDSIASDTAYLRFQITNKAGHKFPSGYPSRRAVVQLVMVDQNQDTLFQSGTFDSEYEVKDIDSNYEPHHDVIDEQNEIQIYEMIMGDVSGNITTVLERANEMLKDNRIPPEGFLSTHPSYDTMRIVGGAENDPDFNKSNTIEGTGRDIVHYHIPFNGATGIFNIYAKVYYQAVPPKWLEEMFSMSSPAIDTFRNMYLAADGNPILAASDEILNVTVTGAGNSVSQHPIQLFNTMNDGLVYIKNQGGLMVFGAKIFTSEGKQVSDVFINSRNPLIPMQIEGGSGVYILEIQTEMGNAVFKVVKM